MSKIYNKYIQIKSKDDKTMLLFKSGAFYIFIDEDAKVVSEYVPLKLTNLNQDIVKCGFPLNSLDKYIHIFDKLNFDIKIIELESDIDICNRIISKLTKVNLDKTTPLEALNILTDIKRLI